MDLRSIINPQAGEAIKSASSLQQSYAGAPQTPSQPAPPLRQSPYRASSDQSIPYATRQSSHDYPSQPLQRPPYASPSVSSVVLQSQPDGSWRPPPPHAHTDPRPRSPSQSSYAALSPYRQSPSAGSAYPFPQSATPQGLVSTPATPVPGHHRESYTPTINPGIALSTHSGHLTSQSSYGQPSPRASNVIVPGQSHPNLRHQRSQSSQSASSTTPTSALTFSHHPQDSPLSGPSYGQLQYPPAQQRHQSQPGTPLGPPVGILPRQVSGPYPQITSPIERRPQSSGTVYAYGPPRTSPQPMIASLPRKSSVNSHTSHRASFDEQRSQHRLSQSSRERSQSVSPKTRVYSIPRNDMNSPAQAQRYLPPTPQLPQLPQQASPKDSQYYQSHPDTQFNMMKQVQAQKAAQALMANPPQASPVLMRQEPMPPQRHLPAPYQRSPAAVDPHESQKTSPALKKRRIEEHSRSDALSSSPSSNNVRNIGSNMPAIKTPKRYIQPPIWARSILSKDKKQTTETNQLSNGAATGNGLWPHAVPQVPIPAASSDPRGLLGPWEPSINNSTPLQELDRMVADFLFRTVVSRPDAGELKARGVDIEIEAKLGQLIDQDTGQRINTPIMTEGILSERSRISFKSSMTEIQHEFMNNWLNKTVTDTHPNNPAAGDRIQVEYKHRLECDSFHDLPASELDVLPTAMRGDKRQAHQMKVRVTRDQATHAELAKIIKTRVADLNMVLPNQPLDCRISVNLEMRYDGAVGNLLDGMGQGDRNKDRMSYKQNHYQVDLTQVTTVDPGVLQSKEHELEIELSADAVVEQGQRAAAGQEHKYAELVEGFVNNIRVLARAVPPPA